MSGEPELPTASVVRSSQATPARRRGQLFTDVRPAGLHLSKPVRCSDNRGHLYRRLAMVLLKLNQGESLDPQELASEFGVNLRTIQRDLNERFGYLPLIKTDGRYRLEQAFLGKLTSKDIERFATLAGVRGLFPSLSEDFLRDILDARVLAAVLVKGQHYEDLAGKEAIFRQLEGAIVSHRRVSFRYAKGNVEGVHEDVEPYKLLNEKGIWYLAARDGGKLKTFSFTKLESLLVSEIEFVPDPAVGKALIEDDGIWFGDEQTEFVLQVSAAVAHYFKRRNVLVNQTTVKELSDGGLIVSSRAGHINQLLPLVRYWIPHVRIISPHEVQRQLDAELRAYVTDATPSSRHALTTPDHDDH